MIVLFGQPMRQLGFAKDTWLQRFSYLKILNRCHRPHDVRVPDARRKTDWLSERVPATSLRCWCRGQGEQHSVLRHPAYSWRFRVHPPYEVSPSFRPSYRASSLTFALLTVILSSLDRRVCLVAPPPPPSPPAPSRHGHP